MLYNKEKVSSQKRSYEHLHIDKISEKEKKAIRERRKKGRVLLNGKPKNNIN